jgi:hypothetical protein
MRSRAGLKSTRAHSVKDLLTRSVPHLTRVTEGAERGEFWRIWLSEHLPAELGQHVSGAAEREATLTVFADSSAWSARLRFALAELEPEILAAGSLAQVRVRVLPRP